MQFKTQTAHCSKAHVPRDRYREGVSMVLDVLIEVAWLWTWDVSKTGKKFFSHWTS